MTDEEEGNNQASNASTPTSTAAGANNATKAAKDRSCPFCGQAFTSSSLGRHLDLYIKPKNPKPPDGVHDVDEIRKIRGNITRRQPRGSKVSGDGARNNSVQREDSNENTLNRGSSLRSTTRQESQVADESPVVSPAPARDPPDGTFYPATSWQATGVINNLPPRLPSRNNDGPSTGQAQRIQEMRRDTGGNKIQRPEYESESMWKLQQDAELGRAAEMALREVLGSLEAAQKRVEPKTLFDDFDFYTLSFPGLCLAILPPPGTLFSPTPFPSAESWTLGPPGLRQYEAMTRFLNERITTKRKTESVPDSVAFKHHSHLSGAWEHWQNMSENDRTSAWTLETLRSFARGQENQKRLRSELEASQQHATHLEAEYDRLSRCQLPREYLMHPPNTVPVSPTIMRDMKNTQFESGIGGSNYDAEALLSKWRANIRATQRPSRIAKHTNTQPTNIYSEQPQTHLRDSMVMNGSILNVGGPMPPYREPHSEHRGEIASVSYETPPNPGAIMEDDGGATVNASVGEDADADADAEAEDDATVFANYMAQNALVRRSGVNGSGNMLDGGLAGLLNHNGKRPYASATTSGRGAKVYKAHEV